MTGLINRWNSLIRRSKTTLSDQDDPTICRELDQVSGTDQHPPSGHLSKKAANLKWCHSLARRTRQPFRSLNYEELKVDPMFDSKCPHERKLSHFRVGTGSNSDRFLSKFKLNQESQIETVGMNEDGQIRECTKFQNCRHKLINLSNEFRQNTHLRPTWIRATIAEDKLILREMESSEDLRWLAFDNNSVLNY